MTAIDVDLDLVPDVYEEISKFVFTSKYARYRQEDARRETWEEAVGRVEQMHLSTYDSLSDLDKVEIQQAFDAVRKKQVGPSMRSMQFGGKAIEVNHLRSYNCAVTHVHSLRSFSEIFYLLLCGAGVGIGLNKKFLSRLPRLVKASNKSGVVMTYAVEDTIEGWADSVEALLNCYFVNTAYTGRKIVFDYSHIRPEGSLLKTSGGKAPGYLGLKRAHEKIKAHLDRIIEVEGQDRLKTIDAYDILMHEADAVLSGGVRRSATAVIFDMDDEDMINAKTGNWFEENPQRARSNNSVRLIRDQVTFDEFKEIYNRTKEWGEPGFVFADHEDVLQNPCFTLDQRILTDQGWRSLEGLLGTNPTIMQDPRIRGDLVDGTEVWSMTGENGGYTTPIQSYNVSKTGEQKVIYRLQTTNGRTVRATGDHHFATPEGMVELADLQPGQKILVGVNAPHKATRTSLDYRVGVTVGMVHMGNELSKEDSKYLNAELAALMDEHAGFMVIKKLYDSWGYTSDDGFEWLHQGSKDFKAGVISGWIRGHGEIVTDGSDISVQVPSTGGDQDLQLVLQELGVMSGANNAIEGAESVSRLLEFVELRDTDQIQLEEALSTQVISPARYWDKVESVERDGVEDVYCLQEDKNRTLIAEGLVARRCFEISFMPVSDAGVPGVQVCNLTTINGREVKTAEDYYQFCEAASLIGTLQAGYTSFPYLSHTAEELTRKEALLGVSVTGMMENPDVIFDPEVQRRGAEIAVETNKRWAEKLGINQAARVTCVKPEGTSSLVFGTMASGIHPTHSRRMWRRIQMNKLDNVYRHFKDHNPHLCEESIWSANKTDDVVMFPVIVDDSAVIKDDLSAIDHLEMVKSTQQNWVIPGTTEANTRDELHHNVSCTVLVNDDEWDEVAEYLYGNRNLFTAVSLLSRSSDKTYKQAPNESVSTDEEMELFNEQLYNFMPVDYSWMNESEDNTKLSQEAACAGPDGCEIVSI